MAASLDTAPTSPELNGNDNWVTLESTLVVPDPAYLTLTFASSGPVAAEELDVIFNGITITFTVAASTNATATAIPTKGGGESLTDYAARVAEALRENGQITEAFQVTSSGAVVRLESLTGAAITDLAGTGPLTNTTIGVDAGGSPYTQDNLAAMLQVWIAGATANADTRLVTLHGAYDPDTAQARFNLRNLLPVAAMPPPESAIPPVVSVTWPRGKATGAWVEYFLRYADKYGTPAVPEALTKSANYICIHGAHASDAVVPNSLSFVRLLHRYRAADGTFFNKPVVEEQPDYVYAYFAIEYTDCFVEREATWDTGDVTTIDSSDNPFDLDEKSVYWFLAGHYPADFTPPEAGAQIVSFAWRLIAPGELGNTTLAEVNYVVQPCTAWDRFLLLDNGLGGCESVLFRGKTQVEYKASRTQARRQRQPGHEPGTGDLFTFNQEGNTTFQLRTGYQSRYYIEHLQQLLLGDAWLIDLENERFLRLVCNTDSIEVYKDDTELYSLQVTFNAAWIDQAKNHPA